MQLKIGQLEQNELEHIDEMQKMIDEMHKMQMEQRDEMQLKIGQLEQQKLDQMEQIDEMQKTQLEHQKLDMLVMKLKIGQVEQLEQIDEMQKKQLERIDEMQHQDRMFSSTSSSEVSSTVGSDATSYNQQRVHIPTALGSHHQDQASLSTSYNSAQSLFAGVSNITSGATKAETMPAERQDSDDGSNTLYETARPLDTTRNVEDEIFQSQDGAAVLDGSGENMTITNLVYDTEDRGSYHSLQSNDQAKEMPPSQHWSRFSSSTLSTLLYRCGSGTTHDYADPDPEAEAVDEDEAKAKDADEAKATSEDEDTAYDAADNSEVRSALLSRMG
eukprot:gene5062-34857_t